MILSYQSRTLVALFIALALPSNSGFLQARMPLASLANKEIAIIFDLNGVLVQNQGEASLIGFRYLIPYALLHGRSAKMRLKHAMYSFFESIETRTPDQALACDQDGMVLPQLMCEWLRGTQHPESILEKIRAESLTRARGLEIDIIGAVSRMIFTPEIFVQTQQLVPEMEAWVRALKRDGYTLYILSNFDVYSFALLHEKYKNFFALFDGIVISGDVKLLKPELAIYEHIVQKYSIKKSHAFFIDDQLCNVHAAQEEAGIQSVICPMKKGFFSSTPDVAHVRSRFTEWRQTRYATA